MNLFQVPPVIANLPAGRQGSGSDCGNPLRLSFPAIAREPKGDRGNPQNWNSVSIGIASLRSQ